MIKRRKSRKIQVGKLTIGGDAPISVQSMTKTDTCNIEETIRQIRGLERIGCELVRVALPDKESALAISEIKKRILIPLAADIHFDYKLALLAIEAGADKLRINPGNIRAKWKVKEVVKAASQRGIPIRVGANSGSLPKSLLSKHRGPTPQAMIEAAMQQIRLLEDMNFSNIVVSLKATDVSTTIESYKQVSNKIDYPLHLGVTEAGPPNIGIVRSSVGIGALLCMGIGDTIRVSLTADPVEEVKIGYRILQSLGLREYGPILISCPTCGRCEIDLLQITKRVEKELGKIKLPIKVAVMGCVVNGPGEAREADVGIAGAKGYGLLFRKGQIARKVKEKDLVRTLLQEIKNMVKS
jgi:(E)-4-hydroxy-3-methylbut-2-enyl-diphosphate synthase